MRWSVVASSLTCVSPAPVGLSRRAWRRPRAWLSALMGGAAPVGRHAWRLPRSRSLQAVRIRGCNRAMHPRSAYRFPDRCPMVHAASEDGRARPFLTRSRTSAVGYGYNVGGVAEGAIPTTAVSKGAIDANDKCVPYLCLLQLYNAYLPSSDVVLWLYYVW